MTNTLLTKGIASPKLAKDQSYTTYILYLASAVYKSELCPNAGDCKSFCLITKAGRGAIGGPDNRVQRARKRKSDWYLNDPISFTTQLVHEIDRAVFKASKAGEKLAIRLNGGSDLDWTSVYSLFPNVTFWEYTKRPELAVKLNDLPNVHVTYSHNERTTTRIMGLMVNKSINIAIVLNIKKGKSLPEKQGTVPIVDGDLSDLRFLDPKGVVVGLRLKSLRRVTEKALENQSFVHKVA